MHSSPFRLIVFSAFISIFHLHAGLEDFTILVSPDGKQYVILAGDNHELAPGTQTERLATAIAECQKKDPSLMEVHVEKPATIFTAHDEAYIITDLGPKLQKLNVPKVSITDCEIRNVSILAFWLFDKEYPGEVKPETVFECGGKSCVTGKATFQDLDTEFMAQHNSLSEFAQQQSEPLSYRLQCHVDLAKKQLQFFYKLLEPHKATSGNILETAIAVATYDERHPEENLKSRLAKAIFNPFAELLDIHIAQKIFSSKHQKQLILSGLIHTRAIRDFLFNSKWKVDPRSHADQLATSPDAINFAPITQIRTTHEE